MFAANTAVKRSRGDTILDTCLLARQDSVGITSHQSARERSQASRPTGSREQLKANERSHRLNSSLAPRITSPPLATRISPQTLIHQSRRNKDN
ncbi:hypothetical protein PCASD_25626 [Puccinia coronata f. sp. avenae]|uniref:Uncharacterized protein n=1 Tax=Puccinia coronata f. sp. avenae TaxID=200324 RepID=A0A2N5RX61_9BASI|nr:hypothetical protein PCASD_25626 [Puccinia coronata f. sp. avenae]